MCVGVGVGGEVSCAQEAAGYINQWFWVRVINVGEVCGLGCECGRR